MLHYDNSEKHHLELSLFQSKHFNIQKWKHFMFFSAWSYLKYFVEITQKMGSGIQRDICITIWWQHKCFEMFWGSSTKWNSLYFLQNKLKNMILVFPIQSWSLFKDFPKYCYGVDLVLCFLAGCLASREARPLSARYPTATPSVMIPGWRQAHACAGWRPSRGNLSLRVCWRVLGGQSLWKEGVESLRWNSVTSTVCEVGEVHDRDWEKRNKQKPFGCLATSLAISRGSVGTESWAWCQRLVSGVYLEIGTFCVSRLLVCLGEKYCMYHWASLSNTSKSVLQKMVPQVQTVEGERV